MKIDEITDLEIERFSDELHKVLRMALEAGWNVLQICDTAHAVINAFEEEVMGGEEDDK